MTCHSRPSLSRPKVVNAATSARRIGQRVVLAVVVAAGLAMSAQAAPLAQWHGPGDHAPCRDRCTLAGAMAGLSPARRAELVAAIRANPMGVSLPVRDGDVLGFMTYAAPWGTGIDRRGFVAVLDRPEPARGWQLDGWRWVRVAGCANWTPVTGRVPAAMGSGGPVSLADPTGVSVVIANHTGPERGFAGWWGEPPGACCARSHITGNGDVLALAGGETPVPDDVSGGVPPAPVPLPAPLWLLAGALAALLGLWGRA